MGFMYFFLEIFDQTNNIRTIFGKIDCTGYLESGSHLDVQYSNAYCKKCQVGSVKSKNSALEDSVVELDAHAVVKVSQMSRSASSQG